MYLSQCTIAGWAVIVCTLIIAWIVSKIKHKSNRIITPTNTLFVGTFVTGVLLFIPVYTKNFTGDVWWVSAVKCFLASVHHTIRLFVVDSDFEVIKDVITGYDYVSASAYSILAVCIFVLSPVLTFGFILSFFKNVSAYKRYCLRFFNKVYVFSELNEQSIAMAKSIRNANRWAALVFADVSKEKEENESELIENAKELGAICFKKDLSALKLGFHFPKIEMTFFTIGEDESKNLSQALDVIKRYGKNQNAKLYVFAACIEGELLLNTIDSSIKMTVRRIDPIRSLTYDLIYEQGSRIFDSAVETDRDHKLISAVVLGLGKHGFEMTKALTWMCQMDGYRLKINAFDSDEHAEEKFIAKCPELMSEKHNRQDVYDEAKYDITVHSKMDVDSITLAEKIKEIGQVTYIFISLGNDSKNIEAAVKTRALMLRMGLNPIIHAVVYDSEKNVALNGAQGDNIEYVGALETVYSQEVVINSKLEAMALERHLSYYKTEDKPELTKEEEKEAKDAFWKNEYNYRSSVASAIHPMLRAHCKMPGANKPLKDRTEEELNILRIIEHNRWNAYTRTEGYSYGEKNHAAKTHNFLVPFHELPPDQQLKDDV